MANDLYPPHVLRALECEPQADVVFIPAIQDHKAWFIGETPSRISRDADLMFRALVREHEVLDLSAVTVGIDSYNTEAEAAGCRVKFYEGDDTSIPGIAPDGHILRVGDDLTHAPIPNPLRDGRMPVYIEAARRLRREWGNQVWIRGSVCGPFSMCVSLMGPERFFLCALDHPDYTRHVMDYACRITKVYAQAFIDAGVGLCMFDSQTSPELLSPKMYAAYAAPAVTEMMAWFKTQGVPHVPLIVGGNTTKIINQLTGTGANNLLCDFSADWEQWRAAAALHGRAVRRNLDPRFLLKATPDQIYATATEKLAESADYPGFIMGTSVISFGTPSEKILAVRQACRDWSRTRKNASTP